MAGSIRDRTSRRALPAARNCCHTGAVNCRRRRFGRPPAACGAGDSRAAPPRGAPHASSLPSPFGQTCERVALRPRASPADRHRQRECLASRHPDSHKQTDRRTRATARAEPPALRGPPTPVRWRVPPSPDYSAYRIADAPGPSSCATALRQLFNAERVPKECGRRGS